MPLGRQASCSIKKINGLQKISKETSQTSLVGQNLHWKFEQQTPSVGLYHIILGIKRFGFSR